jgi:hypothetical protein
MSIRTLCLDTRFRTPLVVTAGMLALSLAMLLAAALLG